MSFISIQLFIIIAAIVYFLPAILAYNYEHENAQDIALIDILFGWTIIGWLIAFIWVFSKPGGKFDKLIRRIRKKL